MYMYEKGHPDNKIAVSTGVIKVNFFTIHHTVYINSGTFP